MDLFMRQYFNIMFYTIFKCFRQISFYYWSIIFIFLTIFIKRRFMLNIIHHFIINNLLKIFRIIFLIFIFLSFIFLIFIFCKFFLSFIFFIFIQIFILIFIQIFIFLIFILIFILSFIQIFIQIFIFLIFISRILFKVFIINCI